MKIVLTICAFLCLLGCESNYVRYGVKRSDPQLIYPERYKETLLDPYRYQSTLLDSPFIEIVHLTVDAPNDYDSLRSTLRFDGLFEEKGVKLISVEMNIKRKNGVMIMPTSQNRPVLPLTSPTSPIPIVSNIYDRSDVPEQIIQFVNIVIMVESELKNLRYELILQKSNSGGWGAAMSV